MCTLYSLINPNVYFPAGRLTELDLTAYQWEISENGRNVPCETAHWSTGHMRKDRGGTLSLKTENELQVVTSKWITASTFWCFLFVGMSLFCFSCFVLFCFKESTRSAQEVLNRLLLFKVTLNKLKDIKYFIYHYTLTETIISW